MSSVRVGKFVVAADSMEEVDMLQEAVDLLREEVEADKKKAALGAVQDTLNWYIQKYGHLVINANVYDKNGLAVEFNSLVLNRDYEVELKGW